MSICSCYDAVEASGMCVKVFNRVALADTDYTNL